jgi:Tfp pilus assembly protein PilV
MVIELMISMVVLAIGMLAGVGLMLAAMQTDSRNQTDTTATVLDQEIIEKFATLKNYPKPGFVSVYDCALTGSNTHEASLGEGPAPTGNGATLFTSATAPSLAQVGDVDWTQPTPVLATSAAQGYAAEYQTCSGDIYEVRWNVMQINSHISLLTVSARPHSAVLADGGSQSRAILYALPVTLRTLITN